LSKYTRQLNMKLSPEMSEDLTVLSEYLGLKVSEMIRGWVKDKVLEFQDNKQFRTWKEKREKER